jgi:selenocysteine lyase/cysteine desulfurase
MSAINKLVDVLRLRDEEIRRRIVVFINRFGHHSNISPWKKTGVEVKFFLKLYFTNHKFYL